MSEEVDIKILHNKLIDQLVEQEFIKSAEVATAFRSVPRHFFLPDVSPEEVFKDQAIPTHFDEDGLPISSSSQPAIMAIMLEQLALQPNQNILEVGAGTGYNAALMGYLVGKGGRVTTLDIDEVIVTAAREHLNAAESHNVTVVCGDGMTGFAANAPYDAIILTVGGWEIAPAWLEQLKPDGRILLPLSFNGPQLSIAFAREENGLNSVSIEPCGFMLLRGPNAGTRKVVTLNEEKTMHLGYEEDLKRPRQINGEHLSLWLSGLYKDIGSGVEITFRDIWQSLLLWLALHEPQLVHMGAREEAIELIPRLLSGGKSNPWSMTVGLVGEAGMAFFERPLDWSPPQKESSEESKPFELFIRSYGSADSLVGRLQEFVVNWDVEGRPGLDGMRIQVLPLDHPPVGEISIHRRWHQFVIDWP